MLERALRFLREEVAPNAEALDQDPSQLASAMDRMGALGLLALKRPCEFGGPNLPEPEFRTFQEESARASGTFAFLQTQHQSAVGMIARSDNDALRQRVLPQAADGTARIGLGFAQLRRSGPPVLRAERVQCGYRIDGHIPWITGRGFFHEVLIGAALPSGEAVFGLVPFTPQPGLAFGEPMRLAAMQAAQTVTADLEGWLLRDEDVVFVKPSGWIQANDEINIALQGHFAIGNALGSLDVLRVAAERKGNPVLAEALKALEGELESCRAATARAQVQASAANREERLHVRAWAIELAVRCAHAAIAATSGGANQLSHPAQRLYREALVYTVSAQTTPIMEATLARLARL